MQPGKSPLFILYIVDKELTNLIDGSGILRCLRRLP